MPAWEIIAIIAVIAIVAIGLVVLLTQRRSQRLRSRFGPEYQRAIRETGDRRRAERELERREKRVDRLHIHPLGPQQRDQFVAAWRRDQARFVDDPKGAVAEADR